MEVDKERKARQRTTLLRRNRSRRWCIPPAILHEPDEVLEATQILDEWPGDVGLVLWQTLRDVTLWASVPADLRTGLFSSQAAQHRLQLLLASGVEPGLDFSLTSLAALVGNPDEARPEMVSLVCIQISHSAEARGAFATALSFAQAAALATPEEPEPAFAVGSLALRWGRLARAETWLRRCIGLSRRARDWSTYSQSYVQLGALYASGGNPAGAKRYYVMSVRAARRHGLMPLRGAGLHGLLGLALEAGELDDAERLARAAMRAYGRGHPRLPELTHDIAYLWVSRGQHHRAIPMLQRLVTSRVEPGPRAFTLSLLARAAAGAGDKRVYEEAWSEAWSLINRRPGEELRYARPLLELTRAAVAAGDWLHMEWAARLAIAAAEAQRDPRLARQVEEARRRRHDPDG
jgi:tetratricopeptide (TPR) repeat protein